MDERNALPRPPERMPPFLLPRLPELFPSGPPPPDPLPLPPTPPARSEVGLKRIPGLGAPALHSGGGAILPALPPTLTPPVPAPIRPKPPLPERTPAGPLAAPPPPLPSATPRSWRTLPHTRRPPPLSSSLPPPPPPPPTPPTPLTPSMTSPSSHTTGGPMSVPLPLSDASRTCATDTWRRASAGAADANAAVTTAAAAAAYPAWAQLLKMGAASWWGGGGGGSGGCCDWDGGSGCCCCCCCCGVGVDAGGCDRKTGAGCGWDASDAAAGGRRCCGGARWGKGGRDWGTSDGSDTSADAAYRSRGVMAMMGNGAPHRQQRGAGLRECLRRPSDRGRRRASETMGPPRQRPTLALTNDQAAKRPTPSAKGGKWGAASEQKKDQHGKPPVPVAPRAGCGVANAGSRGWMGGGADVHRGNGETPNQSVLLRDRKSVV